MPESFDEMEARWQRENDAHTLSEAERIRQDPERLKNAQTEAGRMADEKATDADALKKVSEGKRPRFGKNPDDMKFDDEN